MSTRIKLHGRHHFGRPFLNTVNAKIDCEKQTVSVSFVNESHDFIFSLFSRKLHEKS